MIHGLLHGIRPVSYTHLGVIAALGLAFLIIPLMEIYKAIMRAVEKE